MLNLHTFYRLFETLKKEEKFQPIQRASEPTSLFVIFQRLTQVRAQKKYFEDMEAHLLTLAEQGFEQLKKENE
jgi:hypothetical protein